MQYEFFQNGITMAQSDGLFRLGTDAVLLADFAALPRRAEVCDLCAGAGAVGLLLLARDPDCRVTAVELLPEACRLARENIARNRLENRMTLVQGDLRSIETLLPGRRFDCVVCNPPYFPVDSGRVAQDPALAAARTELHCTLSDVCRAAARLLLTGGTFDLVHKPERLTDIFCTLREHDIEPKKLRFVRHDAGKKPSLILLRAIRGGKPGVTVEPDLILRDPDGTESEEYRKIYHL